jgi:hypothetical protein
MPKEPDVLALLSPPERAEVIRKMLLGLLGERNGQKAWKQMEPVLASTLRQIGDAEEPEKNYWRGVWRVYEVE